MRGTNGPGYYAVRLKDIRELYTEHGDVLESVYRKVSERNLREKEIEEEREGGKIERTKGKREREVEDRDRGRCVKKCWFSSKKR